MASVEPPSEHGTRLGRMMTEAEWMVCGDPTQMLIVLDHTASDRKLRLFGVACSRRIWDRLDDLGRAAVEVAEGYADDQIGPDALRAARLACRGAGNSASWYAAATRPAVAARNAALSAMDGPNPDVEQSAQAGLLRDIFGNPFRPVILDSSWLTPMVLTLAREMYDSRDFSKMPILVDALRGAGCEDETVLNHLRGPRPHVRGCFVIDLLLARE